MKKPFYSNMKFVINALGILVIGISVGCQKDLVQTEMDDGIGSAALKSAKEANVMVISNSATLPEGLAEELANYGEIVQSIPEIGVLVVKPKVSNFKGQVRKLAAVGSVVTDIKTKWLEPENVVPLTNPPSIGDDETYFGLQWGMDAIDAPEAWNSGVTGEGVRVFILDSGIDAEHPDLAPNLNTSLSTSFVPGEDYNVQPGAFFNHGSHVAGIIAAADNSLGVIGVAPKAEIVAVKVLSEFNGSGDFSWLMQALVYAADNDADVINMSLGAIFYRNGFYYDEFGELQKDPTNEIQALLVALQRAVNYAYKKGVVIVASAGNDGVNLDGFGSVITIPAEMNNIITVSASAPHGWAYDTSVNLDEIASYSNTGRSLVDVAGPGGDFTLYPDPNYKYDMVLSTGSEAYYFAAGTSMASPHVAGVAALIISKNAGNITNHEVEKQLIKTADKLDGNGKSVSFGKGRVNAYRAVTE